MHSVSVLYESVSTSPSRLPSPPTSPCLTPPPSIPPHVSLPHASLANAPLPHAVLANAPLPHGSLANAPLPHVSQHHAFFTLFYLYLIIKKCLTENLFWFLLQTIEAMFRMDVKLHGFLH